MKQLFIVLLACLGYVQSNTARAQINGEMAAHCSAVLLYAAGDSQGENKVKFQYLKNQFLKQCAQSLGDDECVKAHKLHKLVAQQMSVEEFWKRAGECVQISN
jgi:hypothetical protein